MYAEVMRENAWLSRTIEVQDGQSVVSTELYGIVRHPMYMATVLMYLAMPLVLGSLVAFGIMLLYIPIIIRRINDEEQLLNAELPGYSEYCTQVRWRLIPYIY
jgi:protein-S-isoprenylcysteine O-methyltransferase Ste14